MYQVIWHIFSLDTFSLVLQQLHATSQKIEKETEMLISMS